MPLPVNLTLYLPANTSLCSLTAVFGMVARTAAEIYLKRTTSIGKEKSNAMLS